MKIGNRETHPAADVLPLMDPQEFKALCEDIEMNGQRMPVVLFGGLILDGRNRAMACEQLEIEPACIDAAELDPPVRTEVEAIQYAKGVNFIRRNLNDLQRALALSRMGDLYARIMRKERKKAAPMLPGVSEVCAEMVDIIEDSAAPELRAAIDAGAVSSIPVAAEIARLSPDDQRAVVARIEERLANEQEPERAEQAIEHVSTRVLPMQPRDILAWKGAIKTLDKSPWPEHRHAAKLMRLALPEADA